MGSFIFVIYDIVCEAFQRKLTQSVVATGTRHLTCGGIWRVKRSMNSSNTRGLGESTVQTMTQTEEHTHFKSCYKIIFFSYNQSEQGIQTKTVGWIRKQRVNKFSSDHPSTK